MAAPHGIPHADTPPKSSGSGGLIWIVAVLAVAAVAFWGWRTWGHKAPAVAPASNPPAAAPAQPQPPASDQAKSDPNANGAGAPRGERLNM